MSAGKKGRHGNKPSVLFPESPECRAFPQGLSTQILQIILIDKINKLNTLSLLLGAGLPRVPDSSPVKARWGRDEGLGGKDYGNAFFRFAAKRLGLQRRGDPTGDPQGRAR